VTVGVVVAPVPISETAAQQATRLLAVFAAVDLVSGLASILLARPLAEALGLASGTPVVLAGVALVALAATGGAAAGARPTRLAAGLRRQAVLDVAFAGLVAAIALAGDATRGGAALLLVAAGAVLALAAVEAALAQRLPPGRT
jgi:hypothetical protein